MLEDAADDLQAVEHGTGAPAVKVLGGKGAHDVGGSDGDGVGVLQEREFEAVHEMSCGLVEYIFVQGVLAVAYSGGHAHVEAGDTVEVGALDDEGALAVAGVEIAEAIVSEAEGLALLSVGLDLSAEAFTVGCLFVGELLGGGFQMVGHHMV